MSTTSNIDELKAIQRSALVNEIIDKTNRCAYQWTQLASGQYTVTDLPWDFYITQSNQGVYALDVLKDASFYRSYVSSIQPEVADLYDVVDRKGGNATTFEKLKGLINAITQAPSCRSLFFFETMTGCIVGSGSAENELLVPVSSFLIPNNLTFGPSTSPWSSVPQGDYHDIADPSVPSNDGDASYMIQTVSGALPTNWGFAFAEFDITGVGDSGPYTFQARVAHRRDVNDGVNLIVEAMANNAVIFSDQVLSDTSYGIYDSGVQPMPFPTISQLTNLKLRLSMFTNTGNADPRDLRISAADITVTGYNVT